MMHSDHCYVTSNLQFFCSSTSF